MSQPQHAPAGEMLDEQDAARERLRLPFILTVFSLVIAAFAVGFLLR